VALGRVPLIDSLLAQRRLVAPFPNRYATTRSYFIVRGTMSALRPEAQAFIDWLIEEAAAETALDVSAPARTPRKPRRSRR
jgi:LysR family glycine cleavage system transcriptional activator